jgi:calcineurin-like phosphoesterase family protein
MIYFTADQHFYHEAIIEYCKRPFSNIRQMEKTIIGEFNSLVQFGDVTVHVGDFSLLYESDKDRIRRVFSRLHGSHILILGNHDKLKPFSYVDIGFQSVHTYLKVEEFCVVHDPATANIWPTTTFLCGHIHNLFKTIKNVINVGVDVWDFKPVSIDTIRLFLGHEKKG